MPSDIKRKGQSLIEVTVGIIVIVPVVLFLVDLSFILWGVESNNITCRSAARAAASGNPEDATERAQAVVDRTAERNQAMIVSNSVLVTPVEVQITSQPEPQIDPISRKEISPGGPVTGTVRATTEVEVRPFVFRAFSWKGGVLKFTAHQTFPITYVMPESGVESDHSPENSTNLSWR